MKEIIKEKIKEYLDAYSKAWPMSGTVLVSQKGEILFHDGYGMANIEHSVPNTRATKLWICSITKAFTAAAIMQLSEKGLISVDDSIRRYLPEYSEFDERITIHQLLTHTSGIANYNNIPDFFSRIQKLYYTEKEFIALFKDMAPDFPPGEGYAYSNSGYYLLGVIIERVSKLPYEEFVTENILKPLGMNDSGFFRETDIVPGRASAYELYGDKYRNGPHDEATKFFSSGGLWSTAYDLYLWDRALNTEKLLSGASLEKLFTPCRNNYGYGWEIDERFGRKKVGHNGFHSGFYSQIYSYIDEEVCIIFLGNMMQNVPGICDDLAAIVFGESYKLPSKPEKADIDKGIYSEYVGEYAEGMIVSTDSGKLYVQFSKDEPRFEIYPIGGNQFNHVLIEELYEFAKDEEGISIAVYGSKYKKLA